MQTPDQERLIGAAMRALEGGPAPSTAEELQFDLDAAVAMHDQVKVYQLVPQLAQLSVTALAIHRVRLQQDFGRDFRTRDFDKAIKAARMAQKRRARGPLPEIQTLDRPLRDISRDALATLNKANDPPVLFVRSGGMVYVAIDEQGRPSIREAKEPHLRGRLDRSANWMRAGMEGDKHIPPPKDVVQDILALPTEQWSLPALTGVVEVPTFRPDGTILDEPGYDPQSRMYYAPAAGLEVPEIPGQPTIDDVDGALGVIDEAIGEFPYADAASKANLIGLFLTPLLRPVLQGELTPLALIDAPKAGTGKSLLVDVFSTICIGRCGGMTPYPCSDEEMEKQIGASLLAGRSLICFDNLEGVLRSPALALAITARDYDKRILGLSENMLVPNNACWVVTGNNIRPAGDMPRRCFQIRLDAKCSDPFRGRTFRHPRLLDWVRSNRGRLLHALLTLARYWFAANRPNHVPDPLGSFEVWHRTVGSILTHAGVPDFLGNLEVFLAEADESNMQWEAFLCALADRYPDATAFTVSELVDLIRAPDTVLTPNGIRKVLPDTLSDALDKRGDVIKRALGNAFLRRREVRFGDLGIHLTRGPKDTHNKVCSWKVIVPGITDKSSDLTRS